MNSESAKALVRNLSKETGVQPHILLTNFMIERLLERISVSDYRENFILKGGTLVAAMVGVNLRSTMDMDATIRYMPVSKETIQTAVDRIIGTPLDDGVAFRVLRIQNIREDFEYACFRFHIEAVMEKTVVPFHIDISTGDTITPREIRYRFKLLLENREIDVLAYNLETILSEKIDSILFQGIVGTRMRDFYDVYILNTHQRNNIDRETFHKALVRTAASRQHTQAVADREEILTRIAHNTEMNRLWGEYRRRFPFAKDIAFSDTIASVRELVEGYAD